MAYRTPAKGGGEAGCRTGGAGKRGQALGTAVRERERGLKDLLESHLAPLVEELKALVGIVTACRLTGRSRATHHRWLHPAEPKPKQPRPTPASALSAVERAELLALMNSPCYAELAPAQIWARELDEGRYHCSVRTMYRVLEAAGQSGERRRQATHPAKTVPELVATAPSQVFTWDITKLAGPAKGIWFHAYVIIDIFSRYVVGHTVERAEFAARAEELIRETIERNGIVPETVHADRGTSMTSKKVSQLLIDIGVTRSATFSRTQACRRGTAVR